MISMIFHNLWVSRKLKTRRFLNKDPYSPVSATRYFDQAVEVEVPTAGLSTRVYYTPSTLAGANGTVMICHHGAGFCGLSIAQFAKEVKLLSRGECGVLSPDARERGKKQTNNLSDDLNISIETHCADLVALLKVSFRLLRKHLVFSAIPSGTKNRHGRICPKMWTGPCTPDETFIFKQLFSSPLTMTSTITFSTPAPPVDETVCIIREEKQSFKLTTRIHDDEEFQKHICKIQARVYEIWYRYSMMSGVRIVLDFTYPCQRLPYPWVRAFYFLNFQPCYYPRYKEILELCRKSSDAIQLEIGCVFGTDIRKLVADAFPLENIFVLDIHGEYHDLGHQVFNTTPETYPFAFLKRDTYLPNLAPKYPDTITNLCYLCVPQMR